MVAGKAPVKVADGVDQAPLLIINRDLTNQVVYGDQSITALNQNTLAIVDPLGSVALDGTTDVYLLAVSGTPTIDVVPGGQQWSPSPAAIAAQIQALGLATSANQSSQITQGGTVITNTGTTATNVAGLTVGGNPGGVPLLRDTVNLATASAQTLAASASVTLLSNIAITQPSFEAVFQCNLPSAAGTIPFSILSILWSDSSTGLQIGQKSYILASGNGAANVLVFYISGPARGNRITVTLSNQDPGQILTYTYAFNQTSHVYLVDRLLQPLYATTAPIGNSNPSGNPSKGLLAASAPAIPASSNVTRLVAASNAKIKINVDNTVQVNSCAVQLNTPSTVALFNETAPPITLLKLTAAAGAQTFAEWQMPNGPVTLQIFNQGAANTITPNVALTIMEY